MKTPFVSQAMLMTAGLGTRLKPFTDWVPKPLLPLMGIPVVQFVLDSLVQCGVTRVVANVHHHSERAREGLMGLKQAQGVIEISDETPLLLGSAGGIRQALKHFTLDSFFYANGDVLTDIDWGALAQHHLQMRATHGVKLTLAVFPGNLTGGAYREVFFDPGTLLIKGLGELVRGRPFFMGAAVLEKEACLHIPPEGAADFLQSILKPAIAEGKAGAFLSSGIWNDVGSPSLWLNTHLELLDRLESRNFPTDISRLWQKRLESENSRLAERIWVSRGSPETLISSTKWVAPAYWDGRGVKEMDCPPVLGPGAVLYGPPIQGKTKYEFGVGFNSAWQDLPGGI